MDPECNHQDVVRCNVCDTPVPIFHCVDCKINLCKDCKGNHLSNISDEHRVVAFTFRGYARKCEVHPSELCELFCDQCKTPVCKNCESSNKHKTHDLVDILKRLESAQSVLMKDLQELETSIIPKYQDINTDLIDKKDKLDRNSQELIRAIIKQVEIFHREIDTIGTKLKSDVNKMNEKLLAVLNKQESETTRTIKKIKQNIADIQQLLKSNNVCHVSAYKSKVSKFRKLLPSKLKVAYPSFYPQKINETRFIEQFGSLSPFSTMAENDSPGADSSKTVGQLIEKPRILSDLYTRYKFLRSVSFLRDEAIWTCGKDDDIIRLYSFQDKLVKSIRTKSGCRPEDIAVTKSGDLVYTDIDSRTVNRVNNTQIQEIVRLKGWIPQSLCSTFSGDLLIAMDSDGEYRTKIVRYSGSIVKQNISLNYIGSLLYSFDGQSKQITENRNLDICVCDIYGRAIVVIDPAGKLRFTYTGPPSTTSGSYRPAGIVTDSQSRILTSDYINHCIHILDQDGQFLRYIDNCHLHEPSGLSVDTRDNLFVAEYITGKVKKIKYCT